MKKYIEVEAVRNFKICRDRRRRILLANMAAGCSKSKAEKEPEVSVQTTPAEKKDISQIVTEEAVIFPLQQATVAPKLPPQSNSSWCNGEQKVKKGQLLAVLENADLSAAAVASQGDFQQAEAAYATSVGASIPQQIQKAELDAASAKSAFDAQEKIYNSRKICFSKARFLGAI